MFFQGMAVDQRNFAAGFFKERHEVEDAERLAPDRGVVEIPYWRVDKAYFHILPMLFGCILERSQ